MLVKDELLDKVVARVREQMPEDQAPQVEEFARQYYGWVDTDDLEDRSPIDAYGAAVSHWNFASQARARGVEDQDLQPPLRGARLAVDPHRRGDGQRRHALPGRLDEDGDKPPGLRDTHDPAPPHEGAPRRRGAARRGPPPDADDEDAISESMIHVEVDRQTEPEVLDDLKESIEKTLADVRAAVEDWPQMRERVGEIVSGLEENPPDFEQEDLAETRAFLEWVEDNNFTFLGYREYDLTTLDGEDALCAVAGLGPRHPEADRGRGRLPQLRRAPARREEARPRAQAPEPDQGQLAGHGAQALLPGLHRHQEVRRVGRGYGGAAVPGALHLHRLQLQRLRHPARQAQGALRAGEVRFPGGEPQREGPRRDPGDLPARRAVPDLQGGALRHRDGHTPPAGAPARQALRQARHLRALLLLPRLRAARPLQHPDPGAHARHTPQGLRRRERGVQRQALGVRARARPLHHLHEAGREHRSTTRRRSKAASSRRPARGRTTSTTP